LRGHPAATVSSRTGVPPRRGRPPAQPRGPVVIPTRPPRHVRGRRERGTSRQGILPAAAGSGAGRGRRANRTFHDQVDVTGLGERSTTDGVDMTMETCARPGIDRSEVRLCALDGAFRWISDGSSGVDRSEVAGNALVGALVQISDRSPAAEPSETHLIAPGWLGQHERHCGATAWGRYLVRK
jgi:hypothetical protein